MNCKPGDLAIVTHDSPKTDDPCAGRIVEVLYFAGGDETPLPDGTICYGKVRAASWVVRFLGRPHKVPNALGCGHVFTTYVVIPDRYLRPLPGDLTPESIEKPEEIIA